MKRKKKYKSVIMKRIWKSARKMGAAFLALAIFSSFMAMRGTNSGFLDEEKSENNIFTATSLDALTAPIGFSYTAGTAPMEPGDAVSKTVNYKNDGVLPFQYAVGYLDTGGGDLCDTLLLTAKKDSTIIYNKLPLKDFNTGGVIAPALNPTESDDWEFILELPANPLQTLENQTCDFNFKFTAWQKEFADNSSGFWDEESADPGVDGIEIKTGEWIGKGDVVINEIMWMGSTKSYADEWIELRNMTDHSIDIGQWKIKNTRHDPGIDEIMIPASKSIPAHAYFLLSNYNDNSANSDLAVSTDEVNNSMELLNSGNGNLILENTNGIVIDEAKGDSWPAGDTSGSAGLHRSMERKDIPGDGTLEGSWHTCISGAANDGTYWDTAEGNNFGTPGAANLSPIVLNEIMFNPAGEDKEWAELFNISGEDIDVSGWYFKNSDGDKIIISKANGDNNKDLEDEGETEVPSEERLVIYFENEYLENEKDEVLLYNDMGTPDDETDDTREDAFEYETTTKDEGDSFMRLPDGLGIWIDPEATPGEENRLSEKELNAFRVATFDACFDGKRKLEKNSQTEICAPEFLKYLGMIDELDSKKLNEDIELEVLELKIVEEEKILAAILEETAAINAGELPAADEPILISADDGLPAEDDAPAETAAPEAVADAAAPEEEAAVPKEELPAEKIEEVPDDEPKEDPIIETPAN